LNVNIIQQRKSINDILHFDLLSIVHSSSPSDDIYDYEIIDCLNNKVENFVFSKHNISCDVNASHFSVTISGFNELRDSKTLSL
jgi:hypothetical protein